MEYSLADKKKRGLAIIFTVLYTITQLLDVDFQLSLFENFQYALNSLVVYLISLITPALVLVFLLLSNKDYPFKKWLLPLAFGVKLIQTCLLLSSNFAVLDMIFSEPAYGVMFVCGCLSGIALAFILTGTLFPFKFFPFFKFGTLAYIILLLISLLTEFLAGNPPPPWQQFPSELLASYLFSYLLSWAQTITHLLFYIGIFILTVGKKRHPV